MTSQWAIKRKLSYGIMGVILLALIIGLPLFFLFHKTPTCFDGAKNQNEEGIDCGGVCTRLCSSQITDPIVLWQRAFIVTPGVYNVVAYIQNPNILMRVDNASYDFRLYDKDNVLISERSGQTFLPANQTFAIFEAGLRTGGRIPVRVVFSFSSPLAWLQNAKDFMLPLVSLNNVVLSNGSSSPRLDATIKNSSLNTIGNIEAVVIIYDGNDNAIAASRTIVQNLASSSLAPISFTWPAPFDGVPVRKEILLRVYPPSVPF